MKQVDKGTSTAFQSSCSAQCPAGQKVDVSSQTLFFPISSQEEEQNLDLIACVQFIKRVSFIVIDELGNDSISKACTVWNGFDQKEGNQRAREEMINISINKLHDVLPYSHRNKRHGLLLKSNGSATNLVQIDWNASGSFFVAAYGNREDCGFSNRPGLIEIWDVIIENEKQSIEQPTFCEEYESELTCVACHPQNPDMFTVGSKSGEIVAYEIEDNRLCIRAISKIGNYFHNAAITSILWHFSKCEREWNLISMGFDGKLLTWTMSNKLELPVRGYILKAEKRQVENENEVLNRPHFVGTAMSAHDEGDILVICIGCDCGCVLLSRQPQQQQPLRNIDLGLSMKWSPNAINIIENILPNHREKVMRRAENQAKLKKKKGVDSNTVHELGMPIDLMYPPLPNLHISQPHWGRINSIDYCDGTFLSTGEDCTMNLHDSMRHFKGYKKERFTHTKSFESTLFDSEPYAVFYSKKVRYISKWLPIHTSSEYFSSHHVSIDH